MADAQYVDLSSFNPENIDWSAYKKWSSSFNGLSLVALRANEGTGMAYIDSLYYEHRKQAEQADIDIVMHYHYAYPQFNDPKVEADVFFNIVGQIRSNDIIMLDYEEDVVQATSEWALAWLRRTEDNYGGRIPVIYSYQDFIQRHLQDVTLSGYPLVLARWTFDPTSRPQAPAPWKDYVALQWTDQATNIPGIPGKVDADVYMGVNQNLAVTDNQLIAAQDMWTSAGYSLAPGTAIWTEWYRLYRKGKYLGPAVADEKYGGKDWNGSSVTRRYFTNGWIEYYLNGGIVKSYDENGFINA